MHELPSSISKRRDLETFALARFVASHPGAPFSAIERGDTGPIVVHVLTQKGRGYVPAITDEADQFHAVGVINPETGLPLEIAGRSWTDEFSDDASVDIAAAKTAAMTRPTTPGGRWLTMKCGKMRSLWMRPSKVNAATSAVACPV